MPNSPAPCDAGLEGGGIPNMPPGPAPIRGFVEAAAGSDLNNGGGGLLNKLGPLELWEGGEDPNRFSEGFASRSELR